MSYAKDHQQEFRELAAWIIDQAKKAGANDCRVDISTTKLVEINYRERRPDIVKEATTKEINLGIYNNNRFASQSTPDFRKSTLGTFINDVIESAKIVDEDLFRTLPDPKYYKGRSTSDLQLADPARDEFTAEERHSMVKKLEDACLKHGGSKVISVEAGEYDETYEEFILSSNGFEGSLQSTEYFTGASITVQDEGDRKTEGEHWVGCRHRSDLPSLEETGKIAAQRTLDLVGGKKIPTETLPVIIENRIVGNLLFELIDALNGRNIQQKRSFLGDRKGQIIGSKLLTVLDDPFIPRALGSKYYDGDGFPARKRELFKEGILNEFLIGWYYGRKLGCEPTSFSTSNIIIPPGNQSIEEIVNSLDKCLIVKNFIGGNSNSTTGDFSMGIAGKLYKKGQFVQNVAEMNIADNHLKFWNKLVGIGNDPWIYSSDRLPSLVFDDVVIAGI